MSDIEKSRYIVGSQKMELFFFKKGYIYYHLIHLGHLSKFFFSLLYILAGIWIEQANSFPKGVINSVLFEF